MDFQQRAAVERDLVGWGVLERRAVHMADVELREVALSAAFRGLVARHARAASPDDAVARALAEHGLPAGAVASPEHRRVLLAIEPLVDAAR